MGVKRLINGCPCSLVALAVSTIAVDRQPPSYSHRHGDVKAAAPEWVLRRGKCPVTAVKDTCGQAAPQPLRLVALFEEYVAAL